MLKVKEGDFRKMGLLYERYHTQLYRFVFNMLRNREISEDTVQNIFLRMMRYPDGFRGFGEFRMWMYHIARNAIYDHLRKVNRTPFTGDISEYEDKLGGPDATDGALEKKQEIEILRSAMDRLSDENRELLILCRFQDLKYSEIAGILNITEGAVKVRVHRAMNELKYNFMNIGKVKQYGMQ